MALTETWLKHAETQSTIADISPPTKKFNDILTCFDFKQHVNFLARVHGHWLDILIT